MDEANEGTAEVTGAEGAVAAETTAAVATETPTEGATAGAEAQQQTFTNPAELPQELQPLFKRMQASYTKKMQALSQERTQLQERAENYDRLMRDPDYARQVILESAPRLGLQVSRAEAQQAAQAANGANNMQAPAQFVEMVKQRLSPELKWMAQEIADSSWTATRIALQPVLQRQEQDVAMRRGEQYDSLAEELSLKAPDWVEHEQEMAEVLQFLSSDKLTHPVYGSKVEMLYNLVTKNSAATREAVRRIVAAPKSRTVTSRAETATAPNLQERIRKAPTMSDAFAIAAEAAVKQVQSG